MNTNEKIQSFLGQFKSQDIEENIYKEKKRRRILRKRKARIQGEPIGSAMMRTIRPESTWTFNQVFENTINKKKWK